MSAQIVCLYPYILMCPENSLIKGFFDYDEAQAEKKRLNVQTLKKRLESGDHLTKTDAARADVFTLDELREYGERFNVDISKIMEDVQ